MNNNITYPHKIIHIRHTRGPNSLSLHGFTEQQLKEKLYNSITTNQVELTQFYITELQQMHKTVVSHTIQDLILYSSLVTQSTFIIWTLSLYNQLKKINIDQNKQKQILLTLSTQLAKHQLRILDTTQNKENIEKYNRNQLYSDFSHALILKNTDELVRLIKIGEQYDLIFEKNTPNKKKMMFLMWECILKYAKNDFISDNQLSSIETFFEFYKIFYKLKKNHTIFMTQAVHTLYSPLESTQIEEYSLIPLTEVQTIYSKRWHYKIL